MPMHATPSAVTLNVLHGDGIVTTRGTQRTLSAGRTLAVAPHEAYAMRADDHPFTVIATMRPSPRVR